MYFQLLHGVHLEDEEKYEVVYKRDKQGVAQIESQPIFASESDLVANFGSDKFRLVPDAEAEAILGIKSKKVVGRKQKEAPDPATPKGDGDESETNNESEFDIAAKKGAEEIAKPPGKEVTERFDGAGFASLRIYRKGKGRYVVTSLQNGEDVFLTEGPIKKAEVEKLIEEWSE